MRSVLICHAGAELHTEGMARWLASFSTLTGILVIHEPPATVWRRVRREVARVGWLRFLDVLAFRGYYSLALARRDAHLTTQMLGELRARYPDVPAVAVLHVESPNSAEAEAFIRSASPDITLALCKNILAERIFSIARAGTFVLHPGICPEYRNAHGCFWALAANDLSNVGVTLLRIDRGIDTGPVFGYFRYSFEELRESHIVIQHRAIVENLDAIAERLGGVVAARMDPIPVHGRPSATWGQPWLTRYVRWKRAASRRRHAPDRTRVS